MSAPVRALWIVNGLGRGGAEQLLVNLAREVDHGLVDLEVAYLLARKHALVPQLVDAGLKVHCLANTGKPWPVELRRLLRAGGFAVVHTHSPLVAAFARVLVPRLTMLVHTEHNVWPRYRRLTRMVNALTIHRNRVVWAVSQGVADSIHPVFHGRRGLDIQVLMHGLGRDERVPGAEDRAEALRRLGLEPGTFTIGTVGNLTAKKDHDTLIEAVALMCSTGHSCRLVLIGGGPREQELTRVVRDRGLGEVVTLTGVRDDVRHLLPAFDVFAMSSRYEGLSIALLEAMAAGLPPVVTRVGGLPEVITDGHDGLLVEPGNPSELCTALAKVMDDSGLREAIGHAARVRAATFGIEPAALAMTEAYCNLASRRKVALTS